MKPIFYITRYACSPPHPRVAAAWRIFAERGMAYDVAASGGRNNFADTALNFLMLTFFNPWSCLRHIYSVRRASTVYILGLRELPIALVGKFFGKRVVYETLDHDPVHEVYRLITSRRILKRMLGRIPGLVETVTAIEDSIVRVSIDAVVVNSRALRERFGARAHLAYYYSPFEGVAFNDDPTKPAALLYLGLFEKEKGAVETMELAETHDLPLFVFGEVPDDDVMLRLKSMKNVDWKPRLSSKALLEELTSIADRHFLIGTSIIKAVHESYRTQEANKEVDYICLGIPFIGNHRETTYQKIESGCGVYFDDEVGVERIIGDPSFRQQSREACFRLYGGVYARGHYVNAMLGILND